MLDEVIPGSRSLRPEKRSAYLAIARTLYAARRKREAFIDLDLFGEPAWDILLNLYIAERERQAALTTKSCIDGTATQTTGLRALYRLETLGYVTRRSDAMDRRSTLVRLTARGKMAMDSYIASIVDILGCHSDSSH